MAYIQELIKIISLEVVPKAFVGYISTVIHFMVQFEINVRCSEIGKVSYII